MNDESRDGARRSMFVPSQGAARRWALRCAVVWAIWGVAAVAPVKILSGCSKSEEVEPESELPAPVSAEEAERGRQACSFYVERLCRCAVSMPGRSDLRDRCELKKAKPRALEMVLSANLAGTGTSSRQRNKTADTARRLIAACIRENNELDRDGCPRTFDGTEKPNVPAAGNPNVPAAGNPGNTAPKAKTPGVHSPAIESPSGTTPTDNP